MREAELQNVVENAISEMRFLL